MTLDPNDVTCPLARAVLRAAVDYERCDPSDVAGRNWHALRLRVESEAYGAAVRMQRVRSAFEAQRSIVVRR